MSPTPIQSGALAGYAELRDTLAPQYQAQLDQIAGGLIDAFAESAQTAPDYPDCAGPFHHDGRRRRCPPRRLGRDRPRGGDRGQSDRRSVAGRKRRPCCATAGSPAPAMSTTRPAQRVTRLGSRSSSPRPSRRRKLSTTLPPNSGRLRPRRLRQRLGELDSEPEPAGERRLRLPERARDPGHVRAVERDRRQSRRGDDQHAQPRKHLRIDRPSF